MYLLCLGIARIFIYLFIIIITLMGRCYFLAFLFSSILFLFLCIIIWVCVIVIFIYYNPTSTVIYMYAANRFCNTIKRHTYASYRIILHYYLLYYYSMYYTYYYLRQYGTPRDESYKRTKNTTLSKNNYLSLHLYSV